MIKLEVVGDSEKVAAIGKVLDGDDDVGCVTITSSTRAGQSVALATVHPRAVDQLVGDLRQLGVPEAQMTLMRLEVIGRSRGGTGEAGLVWEDVLGLAARNSRPIARYLGFMVAAGVIACFGVLLYSEILIVGAMAISPDLLPITAIGVGLVDRRLRLAGRAFATLAIGMACASGAAAVSAFAQDRFDRIPTTFDIDSTVLAGVTHVSNETIVVALAAGVAGMLALETRASSGVGVAVSVTTIPAAAYLGVSLGLGERGAAWGALEVLGVNVAMLVLAAWGTLMVQRALARRASGKRALEAGAGRVSP